MSNKLSRREALGLTEAAAGATGLAACIPHLFSWDNPSTRRVTGQQLMAEGFAVTIDDKPGSALFTYRRHR